MPRPPTRAPVELTWEELLALETAGRAALRAIAVGEDVGREWASLHRALYAGVEAVTAARSTLLCGECGERRARARGLCRACTTRIRREQGIEGLVPASRTGS